MKTICGYCGVGCEILVDEHKLKGDKKSTINEGLLCAKGSSQLKIISANNRLTTPSIKKENIFKDASWKEGIDLISNKIKEVKEDEVAFYLSGQLLSEDYYVANKLAKGFIKTNNIDTNSRTCMASAVVAHKKAFGADIVPVTINDIKKADLLILVGSNAAEAHVVFFNKIKKEIKRGLKLIVIDPRITATSKLATLHLQINIASDIDFFNLLSYNLIKDKKIDENFIKKHTNDYESFSKNIEKLSPSKLLETTGLNKVLFDKFLELYYSSENIISAWTMGLNQSVQGVDKNLSLINTHLITGKINKEGNGPFSLTGQSNAMGGREVGGLSTTLAVHLDFDETSIKKVENFWNTSAIKNKRGFTSLEIIEEALKGKIKVLIISHTDPIYHLPNRTKVEKAFKNIPLIVEINSYNNSETSKYAHIRLPALSWGEKEGHTTNMHKQVSKQNILVKNKGLAKADWEIFQDIAQGLGFTNDFNFKNSKEIFDEFKEMTKLSKNRHLNIFEMKTDSFIWGENIFNDNKFLTKNKKANIFYCENKNLSEKVSNEYPFILLTGRTRDQWHSGTKTASIKSLRKYKELEFVNINRNDAKKLNIKDGDLVYIKSSRGEIKLPVTLTSDIKEKTIFIPVTVREINYLTNDAYDKESWQPDYNHSAVTITKV